MKATGRFGGYEGPEQPPKTVVEITVRIRADGVVMATTHSGTSVVGYADPGGRCLATCVLPDGDTCTLLEPDGTVSNALGVARAHYHALAEALYIAQKAIGQVNGDVDVER